MGGLRPTEPTPLDERIAAPPRRPKETPVHPLPTRSARTRPAIWLAALLALVLAGTAAATAASATTGAAEPGGRRTPPRITWTPCTDPDFQNMDCGTMRVPVVPGTPSAGTVELAMVRRPADDTARRVGTLLLNNGPGSSSIDQLRYAMEISSDTFLGGALTRRFDVIAVDPRGVGYSTPVDCDLPLKPAGITHFPETESQFEALKAHNRALAANCRETSGPLTEHMDLASTARDFEQVRLALGEKQLTWYGITYSTLLGRTYAKLHPGRLRAMVLDTALNDNLPPVERLADEITAAEDSFNRFTKWCAKDTACALHGQKVAHVFGQLVRRANHNPIPVGNTGHSLTGEDIQTAAQGHLVMGSVTWQPFSAALQQAIDGDATALATDPDKTLNWKQAQVAACLDMPPAATTWQEFAQLKTMASQLSPNLGGAVQSWTYLAGCVGWPHAAATPAGSTQVNGAPPALILQSTNESLAAYQSGFGLAAQLPGSRVLTRVGDDYTMYLFSQCVREHTDRYLVSLTMPPARSVCAD
jgi:pimeloyl-ACP methyl ester carboxylesterase